MTKGRWDSGGSKPRAKGKGRRPRTRSPAGVSQREGNRASDSRARLKARIRALTAEVVLLRVQVRELYEAVTGESMWVHEDDLEGNQPTEEE